MRQIAREMIAVLYVSEARRGRWISNSRDRIREETFATRPRSTEYIFRVHDDYGIDKKGERAGGGCSNVSLFRMRAYAVAQTFAKRYC